MNYLSLTVVDDVNEYQEACKRLQILIDGASFIDLVRKVELPWATREGAPSLAGSYTWFRPYGWVVHRDLGVANLSEGGSKISWLLVCDCEELGCKTFSGRIARRDRSIVWQDFHNDRRGPNARAGYWRLDALGAFTFALEQYQAEIDRIDIIGEDE